MSSAAPQPATDSALLSRVQQRNQRELLSKLLHDLRNPIHSIRITMELFGRLARREGDLDKLMERAALYVEPGQAAVDQLLVSCERLGRWLAPPKPPAMARLSMESWLEEMRLLLHACRRRLQVELRMEAQPSPEAFVDRARLSHAILCYVLDHTPSQLTFRVSLDPGGRVRLEMSSAEGVERRAGHGSAAAAGASRAMPEAAMLGAAELDQLIGAAGGVAAAQAQEDGREDRAQQGVRTLAWTFEQARSS